MVVVSSFGSSCQILTPHVLNANCCIYQSAPEVWQGKRSCNLPCVGGAESLSLKPFPPQPFPYNPATSLRQGTLSPPCDKSPLSGRPSGPFILCRRTAPMYCSRLPLDSFPRIALVQTPPTGAEPPHTPRNRPTHPTIIHFC